MKVPKNSPRMKSALGRAAMAKESKSGIGDAMDQLTKENKIRAIVGQEPQSGRAIRYQNDPTAVAQTQEALRKRKAALSKGR